MPSSGHHGCPHLEHFVAAVHRRMVFLRTIERVGLCVLAGCGVSLLLMPILLWRGEDVWTLLAAVLGAAVVAGGAWGLAARPTRLAAAMEADRQLRLADLLGTAFALSRPKLAAVTVDAIRIEAPDPLSATVLAMAEARCRAISPSAVVLHRLGTRGWGGIGLAGALVAGVALLGGEKNRSEARAEQPRSWQEIERAQEIANRAASTSTPDLRRSVPVAETEDDNQNANQSATSQAEVDKGDTSPTAPSSNGTGAANGGTGAGAAQSTAKPANIGRDPITGGHAPKHGDPTRIADGGGGGGVASDHGTAGNSAGGTSAGSGHRQAAPIWQSKSWPADRDAARAAIRSGRVPDAYRDLVRDYFERD